MGRIRVSGPCAAEVGGQVVGVITTGIGGAVTRSADRSRRRDSALTGVSGADSGRQEENQVAEKTPPAISKNRLKLALLSTHSRGAMLHYIGWRLTYDPPATRNVTPERAAAFGAPMPKVQA